jgi:purine-binding chemotaxis protein CheW
VVGISSSQVQPPHPIFADINIQYISGVVEHEDRLYIILDVERIFAREETRGEAPGFGGGVPPGAGAQPEPAGRGQAAPAPSAEEAGPETRTPERPKPAATEAPAEKGKASAVSDVSFIGEALAAFKVFYPSPINEAWLSRRFEDWKADRSREGKEVQLRTEEDAAAFMRPFYSPYTGTFWGEDYLERVSRTLPAAEELPNTVHVWNPGCGKGYETYSLAVLLRNTYPDKQLKFWAVDVDLLSISTAPNLVFPAGSIPDYYRDYLVEGTNGFSFTQELKELILFEYHDILHENTVPEMSLILSRDLLSVLPREAQERVVADFAEKLKPGGIVIPGEHEALDALPGWRSTRGPVNAFTAV